MNEDGLVMFVLHNRGRCFATFTATMEDKHYQALQDVQREEAPGWL